jgi:hypothetical protein
MAKIERSIEFILPPAKIAAWTPVVFIALFNGFNLHSYLTYGKPLLPLLSSHTITSVQVFFILFSAITASIELLVIIIILKEVVFPSLLEILINREIIHRQMDDESIAWLADKRLEWKDLTPIQAKRKEALFVLACSWGMFKYRIELVVNRSLMKIK